MKKKPGGLDDGSVRKKAVKHKIEEELAEGKEEFSTDNEEAERDSDHSRFDSPNKVRVTSSGVAVKTTPENNRHVDDDGIPSTTGITPFFDRFALARDRGIAKGDGGISPVSSITEDINLKPKPAAKSSGHVDNSSVISSTATATSSDAMEDVTISHVHSSRPRDKVIEGLLKQGRRLARVSVESVAETTSQSDTEEIISPLDRESYRDICLALVNYSKHGRSQTVTFNRDSNILSVQRIEGNRSTDIEDAEMVRRNFTALADSIIDSASKYEENDPAFIVLSYLYKKVETVIHSDCNQDNAKNLANILKYFEPPALTRSKSAKASHRERLERERSRDEYDEIESSSSAAGGGSGKKKHGGSEKSTPGSGDKKSHSDRHSDRRNSDKKGKGGRY